MKLLVEAWDFYVPQAIKVFALNGSDTVTLLFKDIICVLYEWLKVNCIMFCVIMCVRCRICMILLVGRSSNIYGLVTVCR